MRTIFALMALGLVMTQAKDYTGYQVFETAPLNEVQVKALDKLIYSFWKEPVVGKKAQMVVNPEDISAVLKLFKHYNIEHSVHIEDLKKFLDEDMERVMARRANPVPNPAGLDSRITFTEYHTYDEIVEYINQLDDATDWAVARDIGNTYDGTPMRALELNKAGDNAVANIYFQAGIHAREWIAPAVATYTMYELVENYDAHPQYADNFNFFMVPEANPDGYEWTWSDDRLWRKTRSDQSDSPGCPSNECGQDGCIGVDPNRNWDEHWGYSGTSSNVCSDTYLGEVPFSEVETQNLRDYWTSISPQPTVTICFHSAAELWLYPYGWDYGHYQDNVDEVREFGGDAVNALNAENGERFELINSAQLYPASGAADDYYASLGGRFVYTPELREGPVSVFVLPEEEILPSGEEVWAAWMSMLDFLLEEAGRGRK